ncbi:MAG: asparaginase domain-containing protein [Candidatus Woesearchaeota archaeon]
MVKSKVAVIYSGGTIGMILNDRGELVPGDSSFIQELPGLDDIAEIKVFDVGAIDSTNMQTIDPARYRKSKKKLEFFDRLSLAELIYKQCFEYDGFVILHGTDTMPETAAALSYMLPEFRKPIVLSGSQRPFRNHRSDGPNNLYNAIHAATLDIGEVVISFGDYILRGTRALKSDEEGNNAFQTFDVEPLGKVTSLSEGIHLFDHRISRKPFDRKLNSHFDTKIFHYAHASGAKVNKALIYLAESEIISGFVLGSFGAGNIPDELLPFIKKARQNDKPVIVYTDCLTGAADMGIYAVGATPLEAGATSAGNMTFKALAQKAMYICGVVQNEGLVGDQRQLAVQEILLTPYNKDITIIKRRK